LYFCLFQKQQPVLFDQPLSPQPWDGTKTGPVCQQGSIDNDAIDAFLVKPLKDIVVELIEVICTA
jgi:hypothetical protein